MRDGRGDALPQRDTVPAADTVGRGEEVGCVGEGERADVPLPARVGVVSTELEGMSDSVGAAVLECVARKLAVTESDGEGAGEAEEEREAEAERVDHAALPTASEKYGAASLGLHACVLGFVHVAKGGPPHPPPEKAESERAAPNGE